MLDFRYNNIKLRGIDSFSKQFEAKRDATHIDLRDCNIDAKEMKSISNYLMQIKCLEVLHLGYNKICKDFAQLIAAVLINQADNIKTLSLNDCAIDNSSIALIANGLMQCRALQHIDLSSNNIGSNGATALSDVFEQTSLQSCYISYNRLGAQGFSILLNGLANNSNVEKLYIRNNALGDIGAKAFAQYLQSQNLSLKSINIGDNEICDEGVISIFQALITSNGSIRSINLGRNKITSAGAESIGMFLAQNPPLQHINIGKNQILDEGAEKIAQGLATNRTLSILNLRDNAIGEVGAKKVSQILQQSNISILNISDNNIGDAGAQYILDASNLSDRLEAVYLSNNALTSSGEEALRIFQQKELKVKIHYCVNDEYIYGSAKPLDTYLKNPSKNIRSINISNQHISDEELFNLLAHFDAVESINLHNTAISHDGIKIISDFLASNIYIQNLNLAANSIDTMSSAVLAEGLQFSKNLSILNLKDNMLGREGAKIIVRALANKNMQYVDLSYNYVGFEFIEEIADYHDLDRLVWIF